jgi:glycosyltransferase involved in cell wall biosynthesis
MGTPQTPKAEGTASPPLITVLITTYNYGRFIEQTIDSVLAQEFPQDRVQIVVVDDGSTDDTAERVKKYGSRIEYYSKANGGQASALNFGISKARGEILALLDADDLFLPGKLARVAEAFAQNPSVGMVYHRLQEWNMESRERRESTFPLVSGDIHKVPERFRSYYSHPTSCISFRRESLGKLLPIPERIRMFADGYPVNLIPFLTPVLALPEVLVVYRLHGRNCYFVEENGLSLQVRKKRQKEWGVLIDCMREWIAANGWSRNDVPVRDFLARWDSYQKQEEFAINPPGRLRFFWFIVSENHVWRRSQTWKFTIFRYLTAVAALCFGYKSEGLMHTWHLRIVRGTQKLLGRPMRS